LADVGIGHEIRRGAATYNGKGEAVLGLGFMITGENPADITEKISTGFDKARRNLPGNIETVVGYQRTDLVSKVLSTVEHNLIYGALLVIATDCSLGNSFIDDVRV
jgi:cobalt-zinc-cadmium resistance protein CzcA